jgi:hypothetical protein
MSFNQLNAARSNLTNSKYRDRLGESRIGSIVQVATTQGGRLVEVSRDAFIEDLKDGGAELLADLVPYTKRPHGALCAAVGRRGRAVHKLVRVEGEDVTYRFRWERLGIDSEHVLSYALLFCLPDAESKVWDSKQVATLRVHRESEVAEPHYEVGVSESFANVIHGEVEETTLAFVAEMHRLHSDDVRKFINGVCDAAHTVSLGGMLRLAPPDTD